MSGADLHAVVRAAAAGGRWADAEAALATEAARAGGPARVAQVRLARADLAERRGRLLAALSDAESAWLSLPAIGGPVVVRLCLALGDPRRARPVAEALGDEASQAAIALQLGEEPGPLPPALRPWAAALAGRWDDADDGLPGAWRRLATGDGGGAAAAFDRERARLDADGRPAAAAVCGVWAASAAADGGRPEEALARLAAVEPLLEGADPALAGAPFDLARARLARSRGDGVTAAALAAAARARGPSPPLSTRLDLRVFGG